MSRTKQISTVRSGGRKRLAFAVSLAAFVAVGCKKSAEGDGAGPSPAASATAVPAATNRIDIPDRVRQNLGISFAKVERRQVSATIRVPGRFELLPSARREYRALMPGRVELLVKQYDQVEAGTPLYRVQSPDWLRLRQQLQDDRSAAVRAEAEVRAAEAAKAEVEQAVALLQGRIAALAEAGTRRAELDAQLAERKSTLPRLEAEAAAKRAELQSAVQRYPLTLATASTLTGIPAAELAAEIPPAASEGSPPGATQPSAIPRWQTISDIEVRAASAGVVETFGVTNGSWAEQAGLVLSTVDPLALRFRGSALQSDLGRLRNGAAASIVAPPGARIGTNDGLPGKVAFGLESNADTRSMELVIVPDRLAEWARPGVSVFAEVVTDTSATPEAAIPVAAIVQDDLAKIYFRRDPSNPDKVIRVEGDFGVSDGRWVVVQSGLQVGDEVVLDGVFELKLAGGGKAGGGGAGHFHADGTWHAAGTPEPGGKK